MEKRKQIEEQGAIGVSLLANFYAFLRFFLFPFSSLSMCFFFTFILPSLSQLCTLLMHVANVLFSFVYVSGDIPLVTRPVGDYAQALGTKGISPNYARAYGRSLRLLDQISARTQAKQHLANDKMCISSPQVQ